MAWGSFYLVYCFPWKAAVGEHLTGTWGQGDPGHVGGGGGRKEKLLEEVMVPGGGRSRLGWIGSREESSGAAPYSRRGGQAEGLGCGTPEGCEAPRQRGAGSSRTPGPQRVGLRFPKGGAKDPRASPCSPWRGQEGLAGGGAWTCPDLGTRDPVHLWPAGRAERPAPWGQRPQRPSHPPSHPLWGAGPQQGVPRGRSGGDSLGLCK